MNLKAISKHLANNTLPESDIHSILKGNIEPYIGSQYSKGYMDSIRCGKRRREQRKDRLDKEFSRALDFISDLTHS